MCLDFEEHSEINHQTRGHSQACPNQESAGTAALQDILQAAADLSKRLRFITLMVTTELNEMPEEWEEKGVVAREDDIQPDRASKVMVSFLFFSALPSLSHLPILHSFFNFRQFLSHLHIRKFFMSSLFELQSHSQLVLLTLLLPKLMVHSSNKNKRKNGRVRFLGPCLWFPEHFGPTSAVALR